MNMELPSFLQSKSVEPDYTSDRKKKFGIIVLAVLLLAIPLTVWLAQKAQIFNPSAAGAPIELVSGEDSCVLSTDPNKVSCGNFPIKLTSPLGPPTQQVSCTSDNQCSSGDKCFNYQSYPGTCKPAGTICAQIVTRACHTTGCENAQSPYACDPIQECVDFPTPCQVPPGWTTNNNGNPSPTPSELYCNTSALESGCPSGYVCEPYCPVWSSENCSLTAGRCKIDTASPSPSSSAACTTIASNVGSTVVSSTEINYTLTYPASSKITNINLPATPGYAFRVGTQSSASGQGLNADLGAGLESVVITLIGDADKACSPITISYTMTNSCGQTISRFLGPGSASAYGAFCQASPSPSSSVIPSPSASPAGSTTGVSSGTDELAVNLQSEGTCQAGLPVVVFSNQARSDTNNFRLYRNGQPLSYTFAGIFSRPPTTQMKDTGLNLNTSYVYYIEAVDGPLAGKRSNVSTVSTPNTCPAVGLGPAVSLAFEYTSKFTKSISEIFAIRNVHAQTDPSYITCLVNGLSLGTPVIAANSKQSGTSLYFWNQSVSRDTFIVKASECGLSLLNPGNFNGADVKSLVESVAGVPTSTTDGSKYRNVIVEGPCSTQKFAAYQAAGYSMLPDNQCGVETGIDYKVNQYYGPGSGANPYAIFSGLADGGSTGYPMVVATSSATVSPSPSNTSTASATPLPSGPGTVSFKVAETEAELANSSVYPYTTHGQIFDFAFSDANPGVKQIWVEFIGPDGSTSRQHISVEIIEPEPQLTSVDCSLDISGKNLKVTLNGSRLGTGPGNIKVDGTDIQILSWGQEQVIANLIPQGDLDTAKMYKVVLVRNDNKTLPEVSCQVGTTLISLGARLFCREPGKFDLNGVKVTLVDENGNRAEEEVTVDTAGIIKNLKTRLQVDKLYIISVKAPYSLRKNALFTAAKGTNVISPADGQPFILPVGDIAPVILQDGKINTLDRAEIVRQWSVLGTSKKTGDFNRDTKVNSIDWACMRYDFNAEDETIPDRAAKPSPSLLPSATPVSSSTALPSPIPSSSAQASERTAFFLFDLVEPIEGGRYPLGDEFIVDIKISSAVEAANLFSAKLKFDPSRLEVSRIEKGTVLTSWAEETFNNQTGNIALTAGLPNPGLLTTGDQTPTMARLIFKSKLMGLTNISVTEASKIFSNANNADILKQYVSQDIEIVVQ